MKKLSALLLSVLMLFSVTACGKSDEVANVTIWHYYNGPQAVAFGQLVMEFNDTVGLKKNILVSNTSKGSVNGLLDAVVASANHDVGSDPLPSMCAAYADTALALDQKGLLVDLDQYFSAEELSELVDSYIEEGRITAGGGLKIFPTVKSTEIFMLNKTDWDTFAEATGASLDELKTREGMARVAKAYYEYTDALTPDVQNDGKAFVNFDSRANYIISGFKQLGHEIFSVENGVVTFNLDRAALKKIWDTFYVPVVKGYYGSDRFGSDLIKSGSALACVCSSSGATYLEKKITPETGAQKTIEYYAAPAPIFEGGEKVAIQQGAGMTVLTTDPATQKACAEFLRWFSQKSQNLRYCLNTGYLPARKDLNNAEIFSKGMDELGFAADNVQRKSYPVSFETVNNYELYTNKAFKGGTAARDVIENALSKKAPAARTAALKDAQDNGIPFAEAVAAYINDEAFEAWVAALGTALETAVA